MLAASSATQSLAAIVCGDRLRELQEENGELKETLAEMEVCLATADSRTDEAISCLMAELLESREFRYKLVRDVIARDDEIESLQKQIKDNAEFVAASHAENGRCQANYDKLLTHHREVVQNLKAAVDHAAARAEQLI